MDDESARAYTRLESDTGRQRGISNAVGWLAALIFLAAALVLLLAIQQGADRRQLLIGGLAILVLNLLVAIVWSAVRRPNG